MSPFAYERATSVADAVARLGPHGAFLAGGTNLVDHLRLGIRGPQQLVDINRLALTDIARSDDGVLRIGALVRNSDMAAHPLVRQAFPVVAQALLAGASGQLRNMASTGGNLLQRTRCVYFQDLSTPCNKRMPGSGCSARDWTTTVVSSAASATHRSEGCTATQASDIGVLAAHYARQKARAVVYVILPAPK